jgi:hypothetical protein
MHVARTICGVLCFGIGAAFTAGTIDTFMHPSFGDIHYRTSAAFNSQTRMVRLHKDAGSPCSISFGTAPTATTSNARMAANSTEYNGVPVGQNFKVAVIQNP